MLYGSKPVKRWERILVRYARMVILRTPPADLKNTHPTLDYLMAFHYCATAREYRFDRHYEALSRVERFTCGGCGITYRTYGGMGCIALKLMEAMRIAAKGNAFFFVPRFFWRIAFGLGKYMPNNRGGKTTGELEREALEWIGTLLIIHFESSGIQ